MIFPHKPHGAPGRLNFVQISTMEPSSPAGKNTGRNKTAIILLSAALIATWAYILWDKNKVSMEKKETETIISNTAMERDRLQKELEDASARFDELKTISSKKDSTIYARDREINSKKAKIESLLSRNNATESELREARGLIESMNKDIDGYKQQIELLEGQKIQLTREKAAVTEERDIMTRKYDSAQEVIKTRDDVIDVASTLHASNFSITGIAERSGGKEKITGKARRVDKLRIRFDLDENMVTSSGTKQLFVIISDPTGKVILDDKLGSGTFLSREGQEKAFTQRVDVNYVQNQKQTVSFDWRKNEAYNSGNYKIEVFNNGFKIGESSLPLR